MDSTATLLKVRADELTLRATVIFPGNEFVDPVVGKVVRLELVGDDVIVVIRRSNGTRDEFTTSQSNTVFRLVLP
jgi:hypothetical protein